MFEVKQKIMDGLNRDINDLSRDYLQEYVLSVINHDAELVYDDRWATPNAVREIAVSLRDEAKKLLEQRESDYRREELAKYEAFLAELDKRLAVRQPAKRERARP